MTIKITDKRFIDKTPTEVVIEVVVEKPLVVIREETLQLCQATVLRNQIFDVLKATPEAGVQSV
jgi:UTP-glucose-1-phosphate uridylyltransferase